jgi:hypothetical protein
MLVPYIPCTRDRLELTQSALHASANSFFHTDIGALLLWVASENGSMIIMSMIDGAPTDIHVFGCAAACPQLHCLKHAALA